MRRITRSEKQAETRALLIEAAATEFAERGYAEARIDRIAQTAGFSKGAFYSNFGSKEELVLAVLERTMISRIDLMSRAIASAGRDPGRLIQSIIAETIARQQDRLWNLLRVELLRQAAREPRLRAAMAANCAELLSANARLMTEVRERLGLKPLPEPRQLADTFLATMLGASLLHFAGVELAPVATMALLLLSLMVAENPVSPLVAASVGKEPDGAGPV
jgi:TetR/AcrR family transcriptional regulator, transcriptional repressor of aconitase